MKSRNCIIGEHHSLNERSIKHVASENCNMGVNLASAL